MLLALFIGIGGVIGWLFDIDSISYPFQPIHGHLQLVHHRRAGVHPVAGTQQRARARTGFVRRVLSQAVPTASSSACARS